MDQLGISLIAFFLFLILIFLVRLVSNSSEFTVEIKKVGEKLDTLAALEKSNLSKELEELNLSVKRISSKSKDYE